jgi:hypothetical protein
MHTEKSIESLGPPALKILGFQLWIHGRQFPDCTDFWDANWLNVSAHCGEDGASVWVTGAILMTTDLDRFATECTRLHQQTADEATLTPLEPNLNISLKPSDRLGHVTMYVLITPNHMSQKHEFRFGLDQTFLPRITAQLSRALEEFPVRK